MTTAAAIDKPLLRSVNQDDKARKALSRPFMKRKFNLSSEQAQEVLRRHGDKIKRTCFEIGLVIHITLDAEKAAEFEDLKRSEIVKIGGEYDQEIRRLEMVLEANGVDDPVEYTIPVEYHLDIDSQNFMSIINLLLKLDTIIKLYDTLCFMTLIKEPDARREKTRVKKRLMRFCGRTIAELSQLRKIAAKNGKGNEVEAIAPEDKTGLDPELTLDETVENDVGITSVRRKAS